MVHVSMSIGERAFKLVNAVFVAVAGFACLYPFLYVLARSLSSESAILMGDVRLLPREFTTDGWLAVFRGTGMNRALPFTAMLTVVGTAVNICATVFGAYPLSKRSLPGRNAFWLGILITMFFGGGLIPTYLVVKSLGVMDTIWALILPGTVSTFNLIIMKTYFLSIPASLEEAARIEGCNDIAVLVKIVIPLSMASIATITLFYAVGHWNTYSSALYYIRSTSKYPLQLKLRLLMTEETGMEHFDSTLQDMQAKPANSMRSAATIYAIIPILVVYPWLQRYFVKGVLIGSLRE